MTKLALFLQWAALVFALALTAQAAPAASADKHPKHWQEGRGDQGWQWRTDVWLPAKHARVIQCETRSTWTWNSGVYQGAYGFAVSSWDQFKPVAWWPNEAYLASPWQQYQTALAIYRRYGWSGWGCRGA